MLVRGVWVISFPVYDRRRFRRRRRLWSSFGHHHGGEQCACVWAWPSGMYRLERAPGAWPPTPGRTQVSRDFSNVSLPVPVYTHALREDICGTLEDKGRWGRRRRLPIGRRRPLLSQWREWRPSWPTPTAPSLFLPFLTFPFLSLPFHSFPESARGSVCACMPSLPSPKSDHPAQSPLVSPWTEIQEVAWEDPWKHRASGEVQASGIRGDLWWHWTLLLVLRASFMV